MIPPQAREVQGFRHAQRTTLALDAIHAHEIILLEVCAMAKDAAASGDEGTNDILVSDVIRTNELQVWFLAQHVQ